MQTWNDPVKTAKRTYDDQKTYQDVKETTEGGELLSKRQGEMLFKMCSRYFHQVPTELAQALELSEPEAVRDETPRKLALFEGITFEEPKQVGKRVYDDGKFVQSLSEQVQMGKRLSDKQSAFLDTLLGKYADQIENFETIKLELKLGERPAVEADPTTAPVLALMGQITQWAEPTKRGKREYNDRSFFDSLESQFKSKGALSERQLAALKKMAARYADQIPDYASRQEELGLPAPRVPKAKKKEADE